MSARFCWECGGPLEESHATMALPGGGSVKVHHVCLSNARQIWPDYAVRPSERPRQTVIVTNSAWDVWDVWDAANYSKGFLDET